MEKKQKEQIKKLLVYSGIAILFIGSMWFIFAPSKKGVKNLFFHSGLNDTIPQASVGQLPDLKRKAYESLDVYDDGELKAQAELDKLSECFESMDNQQGNEDSVVSRSAMSDYVVAYEDANRAVRDFYTPSENNSEILDLKQELSDLRREMNDQLLSERRQEERQKTLMERNFNAISRFFPNPDNNQSDDEEVPLSVYQQAKERPIASPRKKKNAVSREIVMEPLTERRSEVSLLYQPMDDSTFIEEYGKKERNMSFVTLGTGDRLPDRNTVYAVVDRTTTLVDGNYLPLRLEEPMRLGDVYLPKRSLLIAKAKLSGNRMFLRVESVEHGGKIIPVSLSAFDLNGQEGIFAPGSEEIESLKDVGSNLSNNLGTSFTFSRSAKDQLVSEAVRGVMQGANQLIQKKIRQVKVTFKSGYRLYLAQIK